MLMPAKAGSQSRISTLVRTAVEPMHLAACAIAALVVGATVKPLSETDLFWHVPLGQQILSHHAVHGAGSGWTIASGVGGWTSSEWLGEVTLAWTRMHLGWSGILWFRLLIAAILVVSVLRLVFTHSTARVSAVLMAAIGIPLAAGIQERPQLVSLVLLCPVSVWAWRILTQAHPPRWFVVVPLVFVWAQIHSLWLMAPAIFILAGVCRAVGEGRSGLAGLRRTVGLSVALLIAGCITPVGPRALLLPFKLQSATSRIAEWQPTSPLDTLALGLMLIVGLMVLAWTRSAAGPQKVPTSELLYTAALVGFAMMAYRNVLPALILLIPLAGTRLSMTHWGRETQVGQREGRVLATACTVTLVAAALIAAVRTETVPTFSPHVPVAIAAKLASDGAEHRILNAYNASGALVAFGGPGIRLAVDGRADLWGPHYLNDYLDAVNMRGDWRGYIATLRVTDAVLVHDAPIVGELVHDGWTNVMTDGGYTLLRSP